MKRKRNTRASGSGGARLRVVETGYCVHVRHIADDVVVVAAYRHIRDRAAERIAFPGRSARVSVEQAKQSSSHVYADTPVNSYAKFRFFPLLRMLSMLKGCSSSFNPANATTAGRMSCAAQVDTAVDRTAERDELVAIGRRVG